MQRLMSSHALLHHQHLCSAFHLQTSSQCFTPCGNDPTLPHMQDISARSYPGTAVPRFPHTYPGTPQPQNQRRICQRCLAPLHEADVGCCSRAVLRRDSRRFWRRCQLADASKRAPPDASGAHTLHIAAHGDAEVVGLELHSVRAARHGRGATANS